MMPILDTPITTNDQNIDKLLSQDLPIMLIFQNNIIDKPLEDAIKKEAKRRAGEVLIVRLDIADSADTYVKYGEPPVPALVALGVPQGMRGKRSVASDADGIRPSDVRAHIAHLLDGAELTESNKKQKSSGTPIAVSDATFRNEVLKSKVPVLVDFWAEWCGPCHSIAPHVEKIAQEYAGKVKVAKLDVDANQVMSRRYNVSSIPTMIVFEGGQPAARIVGANPVALRQAVERFVK